MSRNETAPPVRGWQPRTVARRELDPRLARDSVEAAATAIGSGGMAMILDEASGDGGLVIAASAVDSNSLGFMAAQPGAWIGVALSSERCEKLGLGVVDGDGSPFLPTVDASTCDGPGITLDARVRTIHTLADPASSIGDVRSPGHVQPLFAKRWGVLERPRHTEAAVDLMKLAGLPSVAVVCGFPASGTAGSNQDRLAEFCARHDLGTVTIAELAAYRWRTETLVERVAIARMPTRFGEFAAVGYQSLLDDSHQVALVKGEVQGSEEVPLWVRFECLAGCVFGSKQCDCGDSLSTGLAALGHLVSGVLLYLPAAIRDTESFVVSFQPHRGPDLGKFESHLPVVTQILTDLGVRSVGLPDGLRGAASRLERAGIRVSPAPPAHSPA